MLDIKWILAVCCYFPLFPSLVSPLLHATNGIVSILATKSSFPWNYMNSLQLVPIFSFVLPPLSLLFIFRLHSVVYYFRCIYCPRMSKHFSILLRFHQKLYTLLSIPIQICALSECDVFRLVKIWMFCFASIFPFSIIVIQCTQHFLWRFF